MVNQYLVRAAEDPKLIARLIEEQIPLTVCPLSNLRLCGVPSLDVHPLRRMLQAGLIATVNSDDPAYFGGYMNENFVAVQQALDLNEDDLVSLAANGFHAAFIDEAARQRHLSVLHAYGLSRR